MINRESATPLYHQIKIDLLEKILAGDFTDGRPLPSEKQLQNEYGVSSITVRRALGDLETAGYVTRQPGRGTFASPTKVRQRGGKIGGFPTDLANQGFVVETDVLDYRHLVPPADVAHILKLSAKDQVLFSKQLLRANGEPIALGYAYHNYPAPITFSAEELATGSVMVLLERKYGLEPRHADRTTQLSYVSRSEADLLAIEAGDAVIQAELTVYNLDETPMYHVRSLYRGDRYAYQESIRI